MRSASGPHARRRAKIGAAALVGLVVLQQVTGILSNLAVALLPDEWAHRRAILIIVVLLIAIAVIALLQLRLASPADSAPTSAIRVNDRRVSTHTVAPRLPMRPARVFRQER
jgi:hypothetical protein